MSETNTTTVDTAPKNIIAIEKLAKDMVNTTMAATLLNTSGAVLRNAANTGKLPAYTLETAANGKERSTSRRALYFRRGDLKLWKENHMKKSPAKSKAKKSDAPTAESRISRLEEKVDAILEAVLALQKAWQ